MKSYYIPFFCFLIVSLSNPEANRIVKVAAQAGTEKYVPLIKAVYMQMGYTAEFTILPSERAIHETDNGKYDAEIGRTIQTSKKFQNIICTNESILDGSFCAWTIKGSAISIQSSKDLKKYRIGLLNGIKTVQDICDSLHIVYELPSSIESLSKMLQRKRIDIVIIPDILSAPQLDSIAHKQQLTFGSFKIYHLYNKNNQQLIPLWDKALQTLKKNGRYDSLLYILRQSGELN
jgi:ABC-type amino acid transport substrate-binding protein